MAASDFTNVRVESTAPDYVVVRYNYAGSGNITLWRSTDNVSYSQIVNIPSDFGSYPPLYDNDVSAETLYYYKLSDDAGSTFTSAVDVTTQRLFKQDEEDGREVSLPSYSSEEDVTGDNVQRMADAIQEHLNRKLNKRQEECQVCPVNGALILDCAEGCEHFVIKSDDVSDVNSISINCERLTVRFEIPEGTQTEICGWPSASGFKGDECFQAPVSSPVEPDITLIQPNPCEVEAIRYPQYPCAGEYTRDCYDKGSLQWSGSKNNFSLFHCFASVSACCNGNNGHVNSGDGTAIIFSGIKDKEEARTGGYSILFGRPGGGGTQPWEFDFSYGTGGAIKGKPIFGVCWDVPVTATARNFSGYAFMLDYTAGLVKIGRYTNADLHSGDLPALITSDPIPAGVAYFVVSSFPSVSDLLCELYDASFGASPLYHFEDSGHAHTVGDLMGVGFFWVGNPNPGIHAGSIIINNNTQISIWRS